MKTNRLKSKHSQVTIFIIIAVVIIGIALIIVFYPRIMTSFTPQTPGDFVQECINEKVSPLLSSILLQGGNLNPENYILYQDIKIDYLCYTTENYKTCSMQQPFLKQQIESQINENMKVDVENCLNSLVSDYRGKGWQVTEKKGGIETSIVPGSVKLTLNTQITLTKESTQTFDKFNVVVNSEVYDLIMIAESILNYEARYGDSTPDDYMMYYPDIKIEKLKQGDGSKIYILTSQDTGEEFMFATRSLVLPAGNIP